jgi:hypothetical protein
MFSKSRLLSALGAGFMAMALPAAATAAPTGGFFAHINEQSSYSDSKKSVTFYDADDIASGALFSVFIGFEDPTNSNFEEITNIAVDPATGDVYVLGFDSGSTGVLDAANNDTDGDFDLFRIDFQAAYNDWEAKFQGVDARTTGQLLEVTPGTIASPAPAGPGANTSYVTYGSGAAFNNFHSSHSNPASLPGVVEKIGEINRNNPDPGNFFNYSLEFIDQDTLLLLDDSSAPEATDTAVTDHEYRIIERVIGAPTSDGLDGGYSAGTSENWESRRIALVNQDFAAGVAIGHSEVESTAFYSDTASGVRGVWVTESDGGGDDIAFLEIDSSGNSLGYREHAVGPGPYPTSFALDNDPFVSSATNDGKADNIFVDSDTGDIIIIESGYLDVVDGIDTVDREPSVIRREVLNYDDGTGKIQFGAWGQKITLNPVKDSAFLERGGWSAYDSATDTVYFITPDTGNFLTDIFALDLNTGITTTVTDIDDSVALYFGDAFGDVADFFTLGGTVLIDGDLNGDGFVGIDDLNIVLGAWNQNVTIGDLLSGDPSGDGFVGIDDLNTVLGNWNAGTPPTASVVPEPASLALFTIAGLSALSRRRTRA